MEKLASLTRSNFRLLQSIFRDDFMQSHNQQMLHMQLRCAHNKHWNPKFKRLRALKFIKVDIPNLNEKASDLPEEELKKKLKQRGILPSRPWMERTFSISCTGGIFEPYVPPEGDGKKSILTKAGAIQKFQFLEKKSKSMMAVRKIRTYDENFDIKDFAQNAQDIYIDAHKYMCTKDKHKIREVVTERCYPEMMHNVRDKTIHWSFLSSLEPPHVVHVRVTDMVSKDNLFAQITVRFHTQQLLAIYDRFGRLMHGSEILAKDVLEYAIFENNISNEYGKWRLHDKIIPDWLPPSDASTLTYKVIEESPGEELVSEVQTQSPADSLTETKENVNETTTTSTTASPTTTSRSLSAT